MKIKIDTSSPNKITFNTKWSFGSIDMQLIEKIEKCLSKKIPDTWYNPKTKSFFEKGKELREKIIQEVIIYCLEEHSIHKEKDHED